MKQLKIFEMIFYFCYCCIIMTVGVILNKKLYRYVKEEQHKEKGKIVQRILKTFALVQCIGWPSILICGFLLKFNAEVVNFIPLLFTCTSIKLLRAMYTTINAYIGFNSLIIALSRYIFTVHNSAAERIGIRKLRSILISSSIAFPLIYSILNESIIPVEEVWSSIFIPNYVYSDELKDAQFSVSNSSSISPITRPLLAIPESYDIFYAKSGLQVLWFIMLVLTYSNVMEGFLYLHIYIYYFR